MGLGDWVGESVDRYRRHDPRYATKRTIQELLTGALRRVPNPSGEPIWNREWDILCVLDACRWDAFKRRYGDVGWIRSAEPTISVGSASPEWLDETFAPAYRATLAETAYVTGNPYSADHGCLDALAHLDEVWRDSWDEETGTILPGPLTARAVEHYRAERPDRLVVHYMQPHWPYVPDPVMYGFDPTHVTEAGSTENPFDRQNRGDLDRDDHFERYLANLEFVVEHLRETLLQAVDADTVVLTADHATLFGDYGLYKHPANMPMRGIRRVPWAETSATNDGSYTPDTADIGDGVETSRDQQLRDLGYL